VEGAVAAITRDGACDGDSVGRAVIDPHPDAAVIVPPRFTVVPSEMVKRERRSSSYTASSTRGREPNSLAKRGYINISLCVDGSARAGEKGTL
jgi:hypothetical protein